MRTAMLLPLLLVAACSGKEDGEQTVAVNITGNGVPVPAAMPLPAAVGAGTALGLTSDQLDDADLVDAAGRKLGEVDQAETDKNHSVNDLLVELDDTVAPDRTIRLGLDGLTVVPDGEGGWNLRTTTTPAALAAMPPARR